MPAQGTQHIRTLEGNILEFDAPTPTDHLPVSVVTGVTKVVDVPIDTPDFVDPSDNGPAVLDLPANAFVHLQCYPLAAISDLGGGNPVMLSLSGGANSDAAATIYNSSPQVFDFAADHILAAGIGGSTIAMFSGGVIDFVTSDAVTLFAAIYTSGAGATGGAMRFVVEAKVLE